MDTTRRRFIGYALGSLLAGGPVLAGAKEKKGGKSTEKGGEKAQPDGKTDPKPTGASSPKKLLILGGTGFIGPALVEAARARGHSVTLFNRGKTRPELFPDLEKLRGDRDPNKGDGLKALEGRQWDAVFDDTGFYPRIVRASAELLAPNVKQYLYVSSVSAYADNKAPGQDETAAVATMPDPTVESMGDQFQNYGPLKALCEQEVQKALPGRAIVVRPGYIVGPGDQSDRFTWWPVRVSRGGEMLAPGDPGDPIQLIDVRDLAEFMLTLVENGTTGVFNAIGPDRRLTMGEVLETCRSVTGSDAKFTWVTPEFIEKVPTEIWAPIWVPPAGDTAGFHLRSNARAVAAGLKFRPLNVTVKDLLTWFWALPADRQAKLQAKFPPEREAEALAAWHRDWKK